MPYQLSFFILSDSLSLNALIPAEYLLVNITPTIIIPNESPRPKLPISSYGDVVSSPSKSIIMNASIPVRPAINSQCILRKILFFAKLLKIFTDFHNVHSLMTSFTPSVYCHFYFKNRTQSEQIPCFQNETHNVSRLYIILLTAIFNFTA